MTESRARSLDETCRAAERSIHRPTVIPFLGAARPQNSRLLLPGRKLRHRDGWDLLHRNVSVNLVALVPVANVMEPECEASLQKLRARGIKVRVFRGASAIDQARSLMAHDALKDGFTELLWVDADIAFEPSDVDMLLAHDKPFVCGVYPKKGVRSLACHTLPDTRELVFGEGGGLVEILYAAGGFTLVRSSVYTLLKEKLALPVCNAQFGAPFVPYYLPLVKETDAGAWYLAEDFAFSERARQAGVSVYADTRIRLRHIGRYAYQWEDAGMAATRHASFRFIIKP